MKLLLYLVPALVAATPILQRSAEDVDTLETSPSILDGGSGGLNVIARSPAGYRVPQAGDGGLTGSETKQKDASSQPKQNTPATFNNANPANQPNQIPPSSNQSIQNPAAVVNQPKQSPPPSNQPSQDTPNGKKGALLSNQPNQSTPDAKKGAPPTNQPKQGTSVAANQPKQGVSPPANETRQSAPAPVNNTDSSRNVISEAPTRAKFLDPVTPRQATDSPKASPSWWWHGGSPW